MLDKIQGSGRILFVFNRMSMSGASPALVSLLEELSLRGIKTELLLFEHKGEMLPNLRKITTLLPENVALVAAFGSRKRATENILAFVSKVGFLISSLFLGKKRALTRLYRREAKSFADYDAAVAFGEREVTDFVSHIPVRNKVAWVHSNFGNIVRGYEISDFERTYARFAHVVCTSESSYASMLPYMRNRRTSMHMLRDIVSSSFVARECERLPYTLPEFVPSDVIKLVSVGRFDDRRKFDRIIKAASKLKSEGLRFCWIIVGGGELFEEIRAMRDAAQLRGEVILTGVMESAYSVMAIADCVVVTSGYEVNATVAREALIMHKPVIATDFESARELVSEGVNGLICENSAEGVTAAVEALLTCPDILEKISEGAQMYDSGAEEILSEITDVIFR